IVGAELTIESQKSEVRSLKSARTSSTSDFRLQTANFLLPVLCESQEGYRNLCRLITRMKMRAPEPGSSPGTPGRWGGKGEGALTLDELDGCTTGLVALAGRAALDGRQHGVGGLVDRLVGIF